MATPASLGFERQSAETRLAELKRLRGVARLDGEPFENATIQALEANIDALIEAETEAVRRARAATEARQAELRRQLATELVEREEARLLAVEQAQIAAGKFVESINLVLAETNEVRATVKRMGAPCPIALDTAAVPRRLSRLIAEVFRSISGHPHRFGDLEWRHAGGTAQDWLDAERRAVERDIHRLVTEKGNVNGNSHED